MKVLDALNWATRYLMENYIENPRLNGELILAHSMGLCREGLYIHLKDDIRDEEREVFENLIKRRIQGEPLQYILGHQEFWSIDFKVDPRVLIPRPETEILVEEGISIISHISSKKRPFVLDLGTGSGAIAISLAKEIKEIFLVATDISLDALLLAKENARYLSVLDRIKFINGDLFNPISSSANLFDLIISNPPYIIDQEINLLSKEVKDYEPRIAIDGGPDGLEFYRRIISQSPFYLCEEGWLLLEIGRGQAEKVLEMIEREGYFHKPDLIKDLSGVKRVLKAQRF